MESRSRQEHIDEVVDYLLKDQDFLLSKEIRHRIEELNQLLVQAHNQHMKVEFTVMNEDERSELVRQVRGGTLYARITLDAAGSHVDHVSFSGDVDVCPADLLTRLGQALYECPIHGAESEIANFLQRQDFELLGFEPRDLQRLVLG